MPNVDSDEYIFTVESWGQLTPKEIVLKAIDIYDKELEEFAELVKKIE
jgi:DNA-directed RNA polymerase alpha subunit